MNAEMRMRWSRRDALGLAGRAVPMMFLPISLLACARAQAALLQPDVPTPLPPKMCRRLVCIGGTITEILYDLGAGASIVGVDSTSLYPPQALKEKADIGYMRQVSPEGVLSLNPSLVLVMRDSGPASALDQIAHSPVPMIYVDATPSAEAVIGRVVFLGKLLDLTGQSDKLVERIQEGFNRLATLRAQRKTTPRVMFVLMASGSQAMIGGAGTAADSIIALAGGQNAAASVHGYVMAGAESIINMAPDVILTMQHAGMPLPQTLLKMPGFINTPASRRHAAITMDGELLLGFGPRTPDAGLILARHLQALAA